MVRFNMEKSSQLRGLEALLLLSLEVGFRHIRPSGLGYPPLSTDAEPNQEVFDAVLKSNNSEAVADLAWASFMFDGSGQLGLSLFANHIVDLRGVATEPFSRDLRQTFVLCVGYREGLGAFKNVGEERTVELSAYRYRGSRSCGRMRSMV